MLVLRYAYLLALVVWLGGTITLNVLSVPAETLGRFHYVTYVCGGVMLGTLGLMAALGPRPVRLAVRILVVALMLGVAVWSGYAVGRRVAVVAGRAIDAVLLANVAGGLALLFFEARHN